MPKRPKIETGPFGGRYYRKGNKKIYISKNPKSGPCKGEQTEVGKRGGVYCVKNGKRVYYNAAKVQKTKPRRTTTARPKTTQRRQRAAPKPRQPKTPRQPRVNKHLKWLVDHEQVLLPIQEKDGAKAFITSVQAKTRKSPAVHAKYWRAQYGDAPLDGLDGRMYVVKGNRWVLARATPPPPPPRQERQEQKQSEDVRSWFDFHEELLEPIIAVYGQKALVSGRLLLNRKSPPVHAKYFKLQYGDLPIDGIDGDDWKVKNNRWVRLTLKEKREQPQGEPEPEPPRPQQPQRGRFWRQPGCRREANVLFDNTPPDVLTRPDVINRYKASFHYAQDQHDRFHPDATPAEREAMRDKFEKIVEAKRYLIDPKWECLD